MGSRAVVIACADESVAARRFDISDGGPGVIYTRTGRAFFTDRPERGGLGGSSPRASTVEQELLRRVAGAIGPAGLWDELGTDCLAPHVHPLPPAANAAEPLPRPDAPA